MRKRVTGKKAVALVMASLMIASMAGCGSSGSESSGSGNTSVKEDGSIDTSKHEVINMHGDSPAISLYLCRMGVWRIAILAAEGRRHAPSLFLSAISTTCERIL